MSWCPFFGDVYIAVARDSSDGNSVKEYTAMDTAESQPTSLVHRVGWYESVDSFMNGKLVAPLVGSYGVPEGLEWGW